MAELADAPDSGSGEGTLMQVQLLLSALKNRWDNFLLSRLFHFIELLTAYRRYGVIILSKLSFKTFCIEKYADYKSMPSNEVYELFEKKGVIEMLNRDYDILHGFGFEYVVRDIDEFLGIERIWRYITAVRIS